MRSKKLLRRAGRKNMDNEFNAFDAGVSLGGLRNKTQIRILIAFLVKSVKDPLSESMAIEAVQAHGLANYFEATQALDELIDNGSLVSSESLLYITPKGAASLDELESDVPPTVRETALADALNLQLAEKNKGSSKVDIVEREDGYDVTFIILNKGTPLMKLTVYAADFDQADELKRNFLKNPERVYSTVVATLYV